MEGLEFRPATRADLPDMAHLFTKRPPQERLQRMVRRYELEPSGWYLAVKEGRVIGVCQAAFPRAGEAWLQWMRVDPETQDAGVGGKFIDYVEERSLARGARVLRLSTLDTNGRVHYLMGARGYTEWARWTRLERLSGKAVRKMVPLMAVEEAGDPDEVMEWLETQKGFHASFGAVTCPTDFRKFVTLDRRLVGELVRSKKRAGCMVARLNGEIQGVAPYAVRKGELRVLQVVAKSSEGGVAAVHGALSLGQKKEVLSVQTAGGTAEMVAKLFRELKGVRSGRQDYYVFGKTVK